MRTSFLADGLGKHALMLSTCLAGMMMPHAVSTVAAAEAAAQQPLAVAFVHSAAMADDAAMIDDAEIIVSGAPIRESTLRALEMQKEADNIVNIITADAVGRFPDTTVAGALARLPGVAVQRDQGQERFVQVRGAPERWTSVAFDGLNVLGAEGRVFRFDSVPAALISTVELNKTLLPMMPAEALAGRVNIQTFSALENPGLHGLLDAGYGVVDLGDGPQRQIAGRLSWSNDVFGVVVAGSHFMFEQQTDNAEPSYDAIGISALRTTKYITERETNSLFGKLEYAPAAGHRIAASSLYTEFLDHEERNQYTFDFEAGTGTRGFTSGELVAVPVEAMFSDAHYKTSTWVNMLRGDHEMSDWRAGWTLAYVETEFSQTLPAVLQSSTDPLQAPSVRYTLGEHRLPVLSLHDTVATGPGTFGFGPARTSLNQRAFNFERFDPRTFGSDSESYTAKLDIGRDWTMLGADAVLQFGGQYDDRKSKDPGRIALINPDGEIARLPLRDAAAALGLPWTPLDMVTDERWEERFERGYSTNYIDNPAMREQLEAILDAAEAANANGTGNYALPRHNPALTNEVSEKILAGYASNTWTWDQFTVVAGVRVERTKIDTEGAAAVDGALVPLEISNKDTMVFPSLHVNYDPLDTVRLRAAFVSGAARPSFTEQRATVSVDDTVGEQTIEGGNPYLKPERAIGADASAEWYFEEDSVLSVSGFYRDVKDVLFESNTVVGDDRYNFGGVDRSGYDLITTINGEDGELYGVEFVYYNQWTGLPGFLSGFGFQGSLTLLDGDFTTPTGRTLRFPGTSKRITNLTLFYEKYGVSARVSYQHRTDWLSEVADTPALDSYWQATERLDVSVRYQVTPNITLYADANNLTDEQGIRFEGTRARPHEVEQFGRRFLFGVRGVF